VTQGTDIEKSRTELVGAPHMTRLAEEMGSNTITFAFPGLRPKEKMILDVTDKLAELNLNKKDTVVLDLLSNVVLMGTDQDGLPSEALLAEDGSYHVVRSLTVARPSLMEKNLSCCTGLASVLKGTGTTHLAGSSICLQQMLRQY
jgi:hypothetical protein